MALALAESNLRMRPHPRVKGKISAKSIPLRIGTIALSLVAAVSCWRVSPRRDPRCNTHFSVLRFQPMSNGKKMPRGHISDMWEHAELHDNKLVKNYPPFDLLQDHSDCTMFELEDRCRLEIVTSHNSC